MDPRRMGELKHFERGNLVFIESRLDIGQEHAPPLISRTIRYIDEHCPEDILKIYDSPPGTSCPVIEATKDVDYVMGTQVFYLDRIDQTPNLKYINNLYWKRSGSSLDGVVIGVFDAFLVLADAINRAGTTESKAVIEALRKTNIKWDIDVFGGVQFTEEGQNKLAKVVISQIIDGKHITVLPLDVASREPVWPMPTWAERK